MPSHPWIKLQWALQTGGPCTEVHWATHGSSYSGLYRQVVLVQRCTGPPMDQATVGSTDRWSLYRGALGHPWINLQWALQTGGPCTEVHWATHGSSYSGLYRQVVLVQRCTGPPMDQPTVGSTDRWSLYRGALGHPWINLQWALQTGGPCTEVHWATHGSSYSGLYRQVVLVQRCTGPPIDQAAMGSTDRSTYIQQALVHKHTGSL